MEVLSFRRTSWSSRSAILEELGCDVVGRLVRGVMQLYLENRRQGFCRLECFTYPMRLALSICMPGVCAAMVHGEHAGRHVSAGGG